MNVDSFICYYIGSASGGACESEAEEYARRQVERNADGRLQCLARQCGASYAPRRFAPGPQNLVWLSSRSARPTSPGLAEPGEILTLLWQVAIGD